jgi:hypothetical protein
MSPASFFDPFFHHAQVIAAPEGFAIDQEKGRAEDAALDGFLGLVAKAVLPDFILDGFEQLGAIYT